VGNTDLKNFLIYFHAFLESEVIPSLQNVYLMVNDFLHFPDVCIIGCQWCPWNCRRSGFSDVFHIIWNM